MFATRVTTGVAIFEGIVRMIPATDCLFPQMAVCYHTLSSERFGTRLTAPETLRSSISSICNAIHRTRQWGKSLSWERIVLLCCGMCRPLVGNVLRCFLSAPPQDIGYDNVQGFVRATASPASVVRPCAPIYAPLPSR